MGRPSKVDEWATCRLVYPTTFGATKRSLRWLRSNIGSVTRREVGFLIIGIGLGLLLSLAVVLEIMLSLREPGTSISNFGFDKVILLVPSALLLVGLILLAYRKKSERDSN
ncbi:MAG TPA: hypothetical protein VG225_02565 [Terracidiphilus sp.]|jgi:hypothetical protein|nr:hypothetical protein [Terracidiphilus sp.]